MKRDRNKASSSSNRKSQSYRKRVLAKQQQHRNENYQIHFQPLKLPLSALLYLRQLLPQNRRNLKRRRGMQKRPVAAKIRPRKILLQMELINHRSAFTLSQEVPDKSRKDQNLTDLGRH
ncbi:unnamed protein product [Gongylonema pulchrum]|uniref:Uncharacterized protein n=1 Tax=Gongylonema pulchrum TaxID=637853 RepID=A0A3P7NHK5_9BILA|nr:unnamed protein product [Gongylonema pulchrum]